MVVCDVRLAVQSGPGHRLHACFWVCEVQEVERFEEERAWAASLPVVVQQPARRWVQEAALLAVAGGVLGARCSSCTGKATGGGAAAARGTGPAAAEGRGVSFHGRSSGNCACAGGVCEGRQLLPASETRNGAGPGECVRVTPVCGDPGRCVQPGDPGEPMQRGGGR